MEKSAKDVIEALMPLVEALEDSGIAYYLGGSVASSAYGVSRPTQDIDVIADIRIEHVLPLVRRLKSEYYVDADMIRDAIRRKSSFNIIYLDLMFKVDIFLPKPRQFTQQELLHIRKEVIAEGTRPFYLSSPEDIILNKLEWYKMGAEVSTRQWNDLMGVINRQKTTLDLAYLRQWAKELDVVELLERALAQSGIRES